MVPGHLPGNLPAFDPEPKTPPIWRLQGKIMSVITQERSNVRVSVLKSPPPSANQYSVIVIKM